VIFSKPVFWTLRTKKSCQNHGGNFPERQLFSPLKKSSQQWLESLLQQCLGDVTQLFWPAGRRPLTERQPTNPPPPLSCTESERTTPDHPLVHIQEISSRDLQFRWAQEGADWLSLSLAMWLALRGCSRAVLMHCSAGDASLYLPDGKTSTCSLQRQQTHPPRPESFAISIFLLKHRRHICTMIHREISGGVCLSPAQFPFSASPPLISIDTLSISWNRGFQSVA